MTDDGELLNRKDLAVTSTTFKSWLGELRADDEDLVGPFAAIYRIATDHRFPRIYDFEKYVDIIESHTDPATSAVLVEVLLKAEAEWRVDCAAKKSARAALGLRTDKKKKSLSPVPIPVVKCGFTYKNGNVCDADTVPGSARCEEHGGSLLDPQIRQSMLMMAYAKLVEGADIAVRALVDVAAYGKSEIARVQASKEILDRAGITPDVRITVTSEDSEDDRLFRLKKQLDETRERLSATAIETTIQDRALPDGESELPPVLQTFDPETDVASADVIKGVLVVGHQHDD